LVALESACLTLAEQGDVSAQSNLGWLYDGMIPNRLADSAKWYRRAAEQGDARSQNNLGSKYLRGRGVLKDYGEALAWFRRSAKQGFAPAQGNLCLMYADGLGVPEDNVKAYTWCNIATTTAPTSEVEPEGYAMVRDSVEKRMKPIDLALAQELSKRCVQSGYAGCD
jgi:TPR repeat protein